MRLFTAAVSALEIPAAVGSRSSRAMIADVSMTRAAQLGSPNSS